MDHPRAPPRHDGGDGGGLRRQTVPSCYLAHSLLFAPVLAAWGLGLGAHLGSTTMALFAFAVWLVTVAGAYALERAGRRGPAEAVLRRLMYGPRVDRG
ncbi:hypothetical protein SVIOM74S_02629 [Streptomyces violarus]